MSEINFLNIIQVLIAIAMIGFILIQRGPGATAGSGLGGGGGGASGTVFGAKGSGSFLTKATAVLATAFFIITMLIAIDSSETYASAGDAAEQDLGVFGSLDDAEPGILPTGDATGDGVEPTVLDDAVINDSANEAIDAVEEAADNAATAVDQAAEDVAETVTESTEKPVDQVEDATESDDTDGDGN